MVDRSEQWKRFASWQQKEDDWKEIFSGEQIDPVDWEAQLVPHPFVEPERPESDYLLGQALLAVKMRFKPLLYFTTTVAGVFLYGFVVTQYVEDLWLYGLVGSLSALATVGLLGWRKVMMKKAEEQVVLFKRALEEDYVRTRERALQEHEAKEQERISRIKALLNGENDAIEKVAYEHLVHAANWPLGVSFRLQGISAQVVELTVHMPGLKSVNPEHSEWDDAVGVGQIGRKSLQEALKNYERVVAAVVLRAGREILSVCPTLQEVCVSVAAENRSGTVVNGGEIILAVTLSRSKFMTANFTTGDSLSALEHFDLRYPDKVNSLGTAQTFAPANQPSDLLYVDVNELDPGKLETVVQELVGDAPEQKSAWEGSQGEVRDLVK